MGDNGPSFAYSWICKSFGMVSDCPCSKACWRDRSNVVLWRKTQLVCHWWFFLCGGSRTIGTRWRVTPCWRHRWPAASKNIPAIALESGTLEKCLYNRICSRWSSVRKWFASLDLMLEVMGDKAALLYTLSLSSRLIRQTLWESPSMVKSSTTCSSLLNLRLAMAFWTSFLYCAIRIFESGSESRSR